MKISGHKTYESLMRYLKTDEDDIIQDQLQKNKAKVAMYMKDEKKDQDGE